MAPQKRNEYLDLEESQSEGSGYDSEAAEESRISRASKRRKTTHDSSDDGSLDDVPELDAEDDEPAEPKDDYDGSGKLSENTPSFPGQDELHNLRPHRPSKDKTRLLENSSKPKSKGKPHKPKTGVVYLSRIPPFMTPATVRRFLEPYGTITRIFLTPEDPKSHAARVRHGGNKKRSFVDGWVEFLHKRDAKLVAETLNAKIIGGKKGGYYHDDIWNMRYLKGFKWKHLTEQIKNENAERASRLRMEIAQTNKENKRFVESVERAKMLERMEGKRMRKNGTESTADPVHLDARDPSNDIAESGPRSSKDSTDARGKKLLQGMDSKTVLDMVL